VAKETFNVDLDLNSNQLLNALLQLLSSAPGSPAEGRVWYDSTAKTIVFATNAGTVPLGRLDQLLAPTGPVSLGSQRITNLADPSSAQDAASKAYVDSTFVGLDFKGSVRVASTANVTLSAPGATIDGVTMAAGNRVLLKNQTTGSENGIWVWNGAAAAMTRATDADASAEVTAGMTVGVAEGTTNADTLWMLTTNDPITLGTTSLSFSKIGPSTATGSVAKFSATIGDGATTAIAVTHNLGTTDVHVQLYDVATGALEFAQVVATSANVVTVSFNTAPATNSKRVVVLG
jgi:hypothetical protein